MNKIIISMGLAAAGTAVYQMNCAAQQAPGLETTPKDWNVSAALRGFYDNNYATESGGARLGSYGIEMSPTIAANVPLRQTEIGVLYTYDLQWFEERTHVTPSQDPYDQSHSFNFYVNHSFNENWKATLNDTFVVGQEPELLQAGAHTGEATYQRLNGNNIANNASVALNTDWSRSLSTVLSYGNFYALYSNHGAYTNNGSVYTGTGPNPANSPSYAGELNRDQNSFGLEAQWHFSPETMVDFGYEAVLINYTGNEPIAVANNGAVIYSDRRDSLEHKVYLGAQHNLRPNLVVAAKAGIEYYDAYNNDIPGQSDTSLSPYADLSVIYTYLPGCNAQLGFTQDRNATDVASYTAANGLTLDQDTSSLHASINHHFTPKLLATVIGSWNNSSYKGGGYDGVNDNYYAVGVSTSYAFTRNLSGEIDYNYDDISSNVPGRAYQRNRVAIGLSLAY